MNQMTVPPNAVAVKIGPTHAKGELIFLDAAGNVVHACGFQSDPFCFPHAEKFGEFLTEFQAGLQRQIDAAGEVQAKSVIMKGDDNGETNERLVAQS